MHYSRDIHRTLEKNKGEEFGAFSHELRLIFRRAVYLHKKYDGDAVPENPVQRLQKRLDRLVAGEYTDADCNRYAKRLRREGTHLLTFLKYDIEYHNNASERVLRLFTRMRKTVYGSRSMRGLKNTETMATIYTTCEMRRVNPYHFLRDYPDGKLDAIPTPPGTKSPLQLPRRHQRRPRHDKKAGPQDLKTTTAAADCAVLRGKTKMPRPPAPGKP